MAYTTSDLVRAATGMTDTTKITPTRVTASITQADSIIDSKIGEVYQLPLEETPGIIQFASTQLASAILYADEYGEETQNLDKGWKSKFNNIIALLESIRTRQMKLFDSDNVELALTGLSGITGYPNNTSNVDTADPTASDFTINRQW